VRWSALHGYDHGQHEESAVGGVHVLALTGNAWLQPPFDWRVLPYVGGGAGPALQIREGRSSITRTDLDQISGIFARQLGGGLRIGISERLSADLGVRYFEAGNVEQQLIVAGFAFALAPEPRAPAANPIRATQILLERGYLRPITPSGGEHHCFRCAARRFS